MIRLLLWLGHVHRRLLPLYLALIGPSAAYRVTDFVASLIISLLPEIRSRLDRNAAAVSADVSAARTGKSFAVAAYRQQLRNLTDLFLAERLLHVGTLDRCGGRIPADQLQRLLTAQARAEPVILVTAYFGPFDLLPLLLGLNGVRAAALYKPHGNPYFDAQRQRLRQRSGTEFVTVDDAVHRLPAVLESGGTIAVLADHHDSRRGIEVRFLGRSTRMSSAIGILARRYQADVVVAGLRRVGPFRFQFVFGKVIRPETWAGLEYDDSVRSITRGFVAGLEKIVRTDPTQYLWVRPRWGTSPVSPDE